MPTSDDPQPSLTAVRAEALRELRDARPGPGVGRLVSDPRVRAALSDDRPLARLWVDAIRVLPGALGDREAAALTAVAEAHRPDPELAVAVAAALLRLAERRPPDEPPLPEGPAADALRVLDADPPPGRADEGATEAAARWAIHRANSLRLLGPTRDAEAQEALHEALALRPEDGDFWFDAVLLHKWRGRWDDAFEAAQKAEAHLGPERRVLWNLAIAATALGRGEDAARAWAQLGLPARVNAAGMALVEGPGGAPLPPVEVRVPSRGAGFGPANPALPEGALSFEIVSVAPLSPCHGVVQSPTFRETPVDWGDVVLWDGAPVGALRAAAGSPEDGGEGSRDPGTGAGVRLRFPLLEILRRGDDHRFRFLAAAGGPATPRGNQGGPRAGDAARAHLTAALDELADALPEGAALVRFDESLEVVDARDPERGSSMRRLPASGRLGGTDGRLAYGKLLATPGVSLPALAELLGRFPRERGLTVVVPGLYEALGDAHRAGKEHQAWRGLERKMLAPSTKTTTGPGGAPDEGGTPDGR